MKKKKKEKNTLSTSIPHAFLQVNDAFVSVRTWTACFRHFVSLCDDFLYKYK